MAEGVVINCYMHRVLAVRTVLSSTTSFSAY